jgi:hypothetical protein
MSIVESLKFYFLETAIGVSVIITVYVFVKMLLESRQTRLRP